MCSAHPLPCFPHREHQRFFLAQDGGVQHDRVTNFLRIARCTSVGILPLERRSAYVESRVLPCHVWPAKGSVQVVGDVVLVKFSPYSRQQVEAICAETGSNALPMGFVRSAN